MNHLRADIIIYIWSAHSLLYNLKELFTFVQRPLQVALTLDSVRAETQEL